MLRRSGRYGDAEVVSEAGSVVSACAALVHARTWTPPLATALTPLARARGLRVWVPAVYATVNLAAIYHDAVIAQDGQRTFFEAATPTGKYRSYLATSTAYTTAAYALAVIQAAELILEMLAKKRLSDSARWRVVLALEFAKYVVCSQSPPPARVRPWPTRPPARPACASLCRTLCRLRLLQLSGGRMVAQNPLPDSTRSSTDIGALTSALGLPNPAKLTGAPAVAKPDAGGDDGAGGSSQITDGQRAGRTRPSLATVKRASGKAGVAGAAEFVGAQAPIFDQGPLAVHAKLDQIHMLAELLFTLRPLLYGTGPIARVLIDVGELMAVRVLMAVRCACDHGGPASLRLDPTSAGDRAIWTALVAGVAHRHCHRTRQPHPGAACNRSGRIPADRGPHFINEA